MSDVEIQIAGHAGRITLNRPKALNALTWDMALRIEQALDDWRDDDRVRTVVFDGTGEKAFCAGGDIAELYRRGTAGDFDYGRRFWRDEYRMNAKIAEYPKPTVAFMHGFVMGGGVGIGCHCQVRIVDETTQIALPECGIGLVPDVGATLLLAQAPERLGEYLGLTGARIGAGDATLCGFAEVYMPDGAMQPALEACGRDPLDDLLAEHGKPTPGAPLESHVERLDAAFSAGTPEEITERLRADGGEIAQQALKAMERASPLSLAATLELIRRLKAKGGLREHGAIRTALSGEFRFTARSMENGDFLEGVRATIIDKDRDPSWRHRLGEVTAAEVDAILAPLGAEELDWEDDA